MSPRSPRWPPRSHTASANTSPYASQAGGNRSCRWTRSPAWSPRPATHATVRASQHLSTVDELHYHFEKESWFVDAVEIYCGAARDLADDLTALDTQSRDFRDLRDYLASYVSSRQFASLLDETTRVKADLAEVEYTLTIRGDRVRVNTYEGEDDYGAEIEETFQKFQQGTVKNYLVNLRTTKSMNHVEAAVLDLVARLHPDVFS